MGHMNVFEQGLVELSQRFGHTKNKLISKFYL